MMRGFASKALLMALGIISGTFIKLPTVVSNYGNDLNAPYNTLTLPLYLTPGEKPPYDTSPVYHADAYRTPPAAPPAYEKASYKAPPPAAGGYQQPPTSTYSSTPPAAPAEKYPTQRMQKPSTTYKNLIQPGKIAESLTAEASLGGNNYNRAVHMVPASSGYGATGKCDSSYQSNCVVDARIKCYGDYIEVQIEFQRYFTGLIYVSSKYDDCNLYEAPPYGQGSKLVVFKLTKDTCPSYDGYVDADDDEEYNKISSSKKEYKGRNFHIVIQFDTYIISHDDVSFVARCDQAQEGPRQVYFSYTVLDEHPMLIAGLVSKSKLSVEVKKGSSAYGPELYGPIKVGDLLSLVLTLRGYAADYEMRVASCWAAVGPPLSAKFKKTYGSGYQKTPAYDNTRSIELINNDCSLKPRLIGNFEKAAVQAEKKNSYYDDAYTMVKSVTLKAFRFPRSDNVIVRCKVDVCYGSCGGYGACTPVYLQRPTKNAYGYKMLGPKVRPMGAGYGLMPGKPVSYGSSDDAVYQQPQPQAQPAGYYGATPYQMPYRANNDGYGYQQQQQQKYGMSQTAYAAPPKQVYDQPKQYNNLKAYETEEYEQLPPYATKQWKDTHIVQDDYYQPAPSAPAYQQQNKPMYPQPVTNQKQSQLTGMTAAQQVPKNYPANAYPKNEPEKGPDYQQRPSYQQPAGYPMAGYSKPNMGYPQKYDKQPNMYTLGGYQQQQMLYQPPPVGYQEKKKEKREAENAASPRGAVKPAVVTPVSSFIIEQEFILDTFAGLRTNFESEPRFQRSADGSPTILLNNSTSVWANCGPNSISLTLEASERINGTLSVRAHATDDHEQCAANRSLFDLDKMELSLNTSTCSPSTISNNLFVASVSDGKNSETEAIIDCYEEEFIVGPDDDEASADDAEWETDEDDGTPSKTFAVLDTDADEVITMSSTN